MWLFGYASLIWNPDFEYEERVIGYVKGYSRKFWVKSIVQRGTPEKPGRAAVLLEEPEATTWGVAYRIENETAIEHLASREVNPKRETVRFYPRDEREPFDVQAYWVARRTEEFLTLGKYSFDEDPAKTAEFIVSSVGPKGLKNIEYFSKLNEFLKSIEIEDPHMSELERHVNSYTQTS